MTETTTRSARLLALGEATGSTDHLEAAAKVLAELGVAGDAAELLVSPLGEWFRHQWNMVRPRYVEPSGRTRTAKGEYGPAVAHTKQQRISALLDPRFRRATLPVGRDDDGVRVMSTWGKATVDQLVQRLKGLSATRVGVDMSIAETEAVIKVLRSERVVCLDDLAGRAK